MPGAVANWQLKQGTSRRDAGGGESSSNLLDESDRHVSSFALFNVEPWSSFNISSAGDFGSSSQYATLLDEDKGGKQIHSYFGESKQQLDQQEKQLDQMKSSSTLSWRTAGSQELAALVAQKSVERVANCDLPPPTSTSCSSEIYNVNNVTPAVAAVHPSKAPNTVCSSGSGWLGTELLGEALCRSQTRAREAEKVAVGAFQDKDKLMRLFYHEASVSFAYRQWLISLQAENLCLKMCCQARQHKNNIITTTRKSRKHRRSRNPSGKNRQHDKDADVIMRCTIAFALGLSLASAGLLLGWGLGWIFFAT